MSRPALLVALGVAACLSPREQQVSPAALRAEVIGVALGALAPDHRAAIEAGQPWVGATEAEAYLARGRPVLWWRSTIDGVACKVLAHSAVDDPGTADTALTSCAGRITHVATIEPALPCWRLAQVAPRLVAAAAYFERLPLDRQWLIVLGILQRGQAPAEVAIAFGEPYSHGVDEREDGVRADEQLFLDASGDAYGLSVRFVGQKVAGWKIPAERTLTSEAQQRRLQAMERRLTAKLDQMERRSIRQHAETVGLFQRVMQNQEAMIATLSTARAAATAESPGPTSRSTAIARPTSGSSPTASSARAPDVTTTRTPVASTIPWGKSCRQGGNDCGGGSCQLLDEDKAEGTCTRLCHPERNDECPSGYRCGFETIMLANHPVSRGMAMCRPR